MRLENEFTVEAPVEEAWAVLLDVERVAPCLPGAAITGSEGEDYLGVMNVRIGPVTQKYNGTVRFEETDENNHRAVLHAHGKDTRGQGAASATITSTLHPENGSTRVRVETNMRVSGRAAQFGRGVMADVAAKLTDEFAHRLEREILGQPVEEPPAQEEQPRVRKIHQPEPEPLDLGAASYEAVLKRAIPAVGAVGLAGLIFWLWRRRSV